MSKEYIEREAAIEELKRRDFLPVIVKHAIEAVPAADVAPVRYGRWRYFPSVQRGELGKYQCSECKHFVKNGSDRNYCPNCGAVMLKQEGKQ